MNYLDIVLCIPLIWGAWRGLIKGFIIEVSTLIALGLGIYGGIHFSDLVASGLSTFIDVQGNILHLISFALTVHWHCDPCSHLGKVAGKSCQSCCNEISEQTCRLHIRPC